MSKLMSFSQPTKPKKKVCQNGYVILRNAIDTSNSFLEIFKSIRSNRKAKGTPTDEEQDLLRAMLTFASSGLDALIKQLVRDALPSIIDIKDGSGKMFETFIERRLKLSEGIDHKLLSKVMSNKNPRLYLINLLIEELTSGSLQSTEELLRVASYFDIPSKDITTDTKELSDIFHARNQVAHEMDVDFSQTNRNRRPRAHELMKDYTNEIFRISKAFLSGVDQRAVD